MKDVIWLSMLTIFTFAFVTMTEDDNHVRERLPSVPMPAYTDVNFGGSDNVKE
jgi:hypothetical protein